MIRNLQVTSSAFLVAFMLVAGAVTASASGGFGGGGGTFTGGTLTSQVNWATGLGGIAHLNGPTDQDFLITPGDGVNRQITLRGRDRTGASTGQAVTMRAGDSESGAAGTSTITGGNVTDAQGASIAASGGFTSGVPGHASITAGASNNAGAPGADVDITAGPNTSGFSAGGNVNVSSGAATSGAHGDVVVKVNGTPILRVYGTGSSGNKDVVIGRETALATGATVGHLYVPTSAGTPTGVPTGHAGTAPVQVDTSANLLWFYSGAAWRSASTFTGGTLTSQVDWGATGSITHLSGPTPAATDWKLKGRVGSASAGQRVICEGGDGNGTNQDGGGVYVTGGTKTGTGFEGIVNLTSGSVQASISESGGGWVVDGNVIIQSAGNGIKVAEGTNATMGTATLVGGTITVNTTKVTANSRIFLTGQNSSGTAGELTISARVGGTNFTITSLNVLDTRDIAWLIVEPS